MLPVDPHSAEWVNARASWIIHQFGYDRIKKLRVFLPNDELFGRYRTDDVSIRQLFDRVCRSLNVDEKDVDLGYLDPTDKYAPLGTYEEIEGRFVVSVHPELLDRPFHLVSTMVHEIAHILLLGQGRVSQEEYDHEPLTDLLTLFLGFGIFSSNSAISEEYFHEGSWSRWQMSTQGYLTMPVFGYSWALFAHTRSEFDPPWLAHLRLDVRSAFEKSRKALSFEGYPDLRTVISTRVMPAINSGSLPQIETLEDFLDQNQLQNPDTTRCTYCDARIPEDATDWVCQLCRQSMDSNDEALAAHVEGESQTKRLLWMFVFSVAIVVLVSTIVSVFFRSQR